MIHSPFFTQTHPLWKPSNKISYSDQTISATQNCSQSQPPCASSSPSFIKPSFFALAAITNGVDSLGYLRAKYKQPYSQIIQQHGMKRIVTQGVCARVSYLAAATQGFTYGLSFNHYQDNWYSVLIATSLESVVSLPFFVFSKHSQAGLPLKQALQQSASAISPLSGKSYSRFISFTMGNYWSNYLGLQAANKTYAALRDGGFEKNTAQQLRILSYSTLTTGIQTIARLYAMDLLRFSPKSSILSHCLLGASMNFIRESIYGYILLSSLPAPNESDPTFAT